jgi:hypothetical protein
MKRETILMRCPIPTDLSKGRAKRPQYSIKAKRKFIKYVLKHNIKHIELDMIAPGRLSKPQLSNWTKDYNEGKYRLRDAISISRK